MASRSTITLRGWVATTPICRQTASGRYVTSFRIADTVRRRDRESGTWSDSKTTWYTAQTWGALAQNVAESLRRSDPVIVTGHPWLEEWQRDDGQTSTRLVLDAETIGPDLAFGRSSFARVMHGDGAASDSRETSNSAELGSEAQEAFEGDVPQTMSGASTAVPTEMDDEASETMANSFIADGEGGDPADQGDSADQGESDGARWESRLQTA